MKCPKCGFDMTKKDYCMHCGYMTNGNVIDTKKKQYATMLELYFGDHYDKFIRNQNWFVAGILGPTYILCHKHYLVGLLLIVIDILVSLFFVTINNALALSFLNRFYWLLNKVVWATIGNMIYIRLIEKKLNKYKNEHPEEYDKNIQEMYKKDKKLMILKYICFGLSFLIVYVFLQSILNYYVYLR